MMARQSVQGSFRDPSGFIFTHDGEIHRQVNAVYRADYDQLMASGLYEALVAAGLLVRHEEADQQLARSADAYKVIKPEPVPFVSYPYEWCFSQLKHAALATLETQKIAFEHGMTLKDGSAYNVQFLNGRPTLIDTLSFQRYREGEPWVAYRQYCQHFLAPLALMCQTDVRLNQVLRVFIDGVPLDLAASLLPARSKLRFGLLTHLHLHARAQRRYAGKAVPRSGTAKGMGNMAFRGLIDSLEGVTRRLTWNPRGTEWADYYDETNYSHEGMQDKQQAVEDFVDLVQPRTAWDLGANTGMFSRIVAERGAQTVAFDIDPACVERNYLALRADKQANILPLVLDLTNPSPAIGWANSERMSVTERGPVDLALALALVHHLAIANNVPLIDVARYLSTLANALIVEFVEKSDSQVQRLLASRKDVFPDYTRDGFEASFREYFDIESRRQPRGSKRALYLMRKRPGAGAI
jgi:ribosomal protein L11 methylase PrmA